MLELVYILVIYTMMATEVFGDGVNIAARN